MAMLRNNDILTATLSPKSCFPFTSITVLMERKPTPQGVGNYMRNLMEKADPAALILSPKLIFPLVFSSFTFD